MANVSILVSADARRAIGQLNAVSGSVNRLDKTGTLAGGRLKNALGTGLRTAAFAGAAGVVALGVGLKKSIDAAGDFEQELNVLQAVSGATTGQLETMRQTAIALGNDVRL